MNNLTETQKEAISSLVNLTEEFCNRELSQKAERLKGLFPEAFAEPKQERKKIVVEISATQETDLSEGDVHKILRSLNLRYADSANLEVKELPELYTAEDMKSFTKYWIGSGENLDLCFEDWEKSKTIAK
jgi:hypothetical protein